MSAQMSHTGVREDSRKKVASLCGSVVLLVNATSHTSIMHFTTSF